MYFRRCKGCRRNAKKNNFFATYKYDKKDFPVNHHPVYGPGSTGLMIAAERGHLDVVRILLKYGADPNFNGSENSERSTNHPLVYAIFNGQIPCMRELLNAGSDPNAVSAFGTPLELIAIRYDVETRDAFFPLLFYGNKSLILRSTAEMRAQHAVEDIKIIQTNLKKMKKSMKNVYKLSCLTFERTSTRKHTPNKNKNK